MELIAKAPAVGTENSLSQHEIEIQITHIAKGDKNALTAVYQLCRVSVYGFVLSILKNTHDAEDVLQNTFIKVWESAPGYKPQGKPLAWIFTIARNLCYMKLREQQKTTDISSEAWLSISATAKGLTPEDRLLLTKTLDELGDQERQIVMLHAVAGFKHREIAQLLEIPLPTVLTKYHRSIKRLNTLIKEG